MTLTFDLYHRYCAFTSSAKALMRMKLVYDHARTDRQPKPKSLWLQQRHIKENNNIYCIQEIIHTHTAILYSLLQVTCSNGNNMFSFHLSTVQVQVLKWQQWLCYISSSHIYFQEDLNFLNISRGPRRKQEILGKYISDQSLWRSSEWK